MSPTDQWISCKERLPEPGVKVLVRSGYDVGYMAVCYVLDDRPDVWYPGGWGIENTSHWMPIPPLVDAK
jgi:hypothetical protein